MHWGYFSKLLKPQIKVESGDLVTIEVLTHHADDDAERMIKGDLGAESVFYALAGTALEGLDFPMLEAKDDFVIHGFTCANYLADLGPNAQSQIYSKSSVEGAMHDAFRKMRQFLMNAKGLSEDEAISLISIGVDFGVTQVVDGNVGVRAIIRKDIFSGGDAWAGGAGRSSHSRLRRTGPIGAVRAARGRPGSGGPSPSSPGASRGRGAAARSPGPGGRAPRPTARDRSRRDWRRAAARRGHL